ncbi:hypothetical protein A3L22_30425 [Streptomyces griseus subsp. griseus]|nr:hypothetical protein A3L22_30425 [Streptomyces griseus subsp. griseus]
MVMRRILDGGGLWRDLTFRDGHRSSAQGLSGSSSSGTALRPFAAVRDLGDVGVVLAGQQFGKALQGPQQLALAGHDRLNGTDRLTDHCVGEGRTEPLDQPAQLL